MTPRMTEPSPFPARRETVAAAPPTVVATLARIGSLRRCWVLSSIVWPIVSAHRHPAGGVAPVTRDVTVNSLRVVRAQVFEDGGRLRGTLPVRSRRPQPFPEQVQAALQHVVAQRLRLGEQGFNGQHP